MIKFIDILNEAVYNTLVKKINKLKSQDQADEIYSEIERLYDKGKLNSDDAGLLHYDLDKLGFKNPKFK